MTTKSWFRNLALAAPVLLVLTFAQGTVRADEVFIAGSTKGCFGLSCSNPIANPIFQALTFNSSTFSGTTALGFLGIGSTPNPANNVNNLGSFTLAAPAHNYNGQTFQLEVTFTAPQGIGVGISAKNPFTFTATLVGAVTGNSQGGVMIDFNIIVPPRFIFKDENCENDPTGGVPGQKTTCGQGSFVFSVNDVAISAGQIVALTGQITAASQTPIPTPEPATMLLLGTGLTGLAGILRRRIRKNTCK